METKKERTVKSYIAGAVSLLDEWQHGYSGTPKAEDLAPPMALLESARELLDGGSAARELKNAGDRARRAKVKTRTWSPPKKKSSPRRPAAGGIIDAL